MCARVSCAGKVFVITHLEKTTHLGLQPEARLLYRKTSRPSKKRNFLKLASFLFSSSSLAVTFLKQKRDGGFVPKMNGKERN